jgi:predicted amino acid-binding ACT domain protein
MTMAVDICKATIDIPEFRKRLDKISEEMSLKITVQDETIFKAMHRI